MPGMFKISVKRAVANEKTVFIFSKRITKMLKYNETVYKKIERIKFMFIKHFLNNVARQMKQAGFMYRLRHAAFGNVINILGPIMRQSKNLREESALKITGFFRRI